MCVDTHARTLIHVLYLFARLCRVVCYCMSGSSVLDDRSTHNSGACDQEQASVCPFGSHETCYMCIRIRIYIYIYIYIERERYIDRERERYIHTHIYIYIYICMYTYIYIYIYIHIHIYIYRERERDLC